MADIGIPYGGGAISGIVFTGGIIGSMWSNGTDYPCTGKDKGTITVPKSLDGYKINLNAGFLLYVEDVSNNSISSTTRQVFLKGGKPEKRPMFVSNKFIMYADYDGDQSVVLTEDCVEGTFTYSGRIHAIFLET